MMSLAGPVFAFLIFFLFIACLAFRFAAFDVISQNFLFDDESDDDGSDAGSSGTYYFPAFFRFDSSVGRCQCCCCCCLCCCLWYVLFSRFFSF